jgi:hypothetical protein
LQRPTEQASSEKRVASDKGAIAGWVFMAIWLSFLGIFTWIFIRDGGFHQFAPPLELGIMLLFWCFGAAGASYMFGMPIVTLEVSGDDFIARERWLRSTRVSRFPIGPHSCPAIRKTKDSEGDDLFLAEVTMPDGRKISVGGRADLESASAWLSAMDQIIDGR